jgi:hypothetical protein
MTRRSFDFRGYIDAFPLNLSQPSKHYGELGKFPETIDSDASLGFQQSPVRIPTEARTLHDIRREPIHHLEAVSLGTNMNVKPTLFK